MLCLRAWIEIDVLPLDGLRHDAAEDTMIGEYGAVRERRRILRDIEQFRRLRNCRKII